MLELSSWLGSVSDPICKLLGSSILSQTLSSLPLEISSERMAEQLMKSLNLHERLSNLACMVAFMVRDCSDELLETLKPMLLNVLVKAVRSKDAHAEQFANLILVFGFLRGSQFIQKLVFVFCLYAHFRVVSL